MIKQEKQKLKLTVDCWTKCASFGKIRQSYLSQMRKIRHSHTRKATGLRRSSISLDERCQQRMQVDWWRWAWSWEEPKLELETWEVLAWGGVPRYERDKFLKTRDNRANPRELYHSQLGEKSLEWTEKQKPWQPTKTHGLQVQEKPSGVHRGFWATALGIART